jgi:fructokinase
METWFDLNLKLKKKNVVVGTGLIALDIVLDVNNKKAKFVSAGGSCGNVMSVLSILGWDAIPIAKLKKDPASSLILKEYKRTGINTKSVILNDEGRTPVYLQKNVGTRKGSPRHRFLISCPNCNRQFPKHKPIDPGTAAVTMNSILPKPTVFYFDKVSKGSVELARLAKKIGAVILFEPSRPGIISIFKEAVEISDIVKYSHQYKGLLQRYLDNITTKLVIETKGKDGLRYRFFSKNWVDLEAPPVSTIKDSAGAGDWCTAGLIHKLQLLRGLKRISSSQVKKSLEYGQYLAAFKCQFQGPRGPISYYHPRTLRNKLLDLPLNLNIEARKIPKRSYESKFTFSNKCSICGG